MSQTVQAVFENGVLRPVGELSLRQNQGVVMESQARGTLDRLVCADQQLLATASDAGMTVVNPEKP